MKFFVLILSTVIFVNPTLAAEMPAPSAPKPSLLVVPPTASPTPFASPAPAELKCASLTSARTAYANGKTRDALATVYCLKKQNPKSSEVRRLISDIYWWEGSVNQSLLEANAGYSLMSPKVETLNEEALHFSDRLHRLKLRANFDTIFADRSTGQNFSLEGDYRSYKKNHTLFGVYHTSRLYTGNVKLSDWRIEAGEIFSLGKSYYLETRAAYSPDAKISAQYGVSVIPHWVSPDGSDFSIGVKLNHYTTNNNVYTLSPAWTRAIGERFALGLQAYAIRTEHWIYAGQGSLEYYPSTWASLRGTYAGGHSVEGPGLEGTFQSYSASAGFRLNREWSLIPNGCIYRGSIRNENSLGLSLEWRL